MIGLVTLGAVFLAVTGAEALYADLGHFGRKPIQTAWLYFVLPALAPQLSRSGRARAGATRRRSPTRSTAWCRTGRCYRMIVLATAATIIASQAVITGAFSLTTRRSSSACCRGFEIRRTSETQAGQIYIPRINALLLIGVLLLVLLFRSSSALASAYGVAVTGTMVVDGCWPSSSIWRLWNWPLWRGRAADAAVPARSTSTFLVANLLKVLQGGWVPLLIGAPDRAVMLTWRRGTRILAAKTRRDRNAARRADPSLEKKPPHRVPGTAVFLTSDRRARPPRCCTASSTTRCCTRTTSS